jgi:hypothetical protein
VRFWAFLGIRGVQKHHKTFLQKVHVENFSRKNRLFCFIAFSGVSQRREFKNACAVAACFTVPPCLGALLLRISALPAKAVEAAVSKQERWDPVYLAAMMLLYVI